MRKKIFVVLALASASTAAFTHPMPVDDLLRPKLELISRSPLTVLVTIKPRQNAAAATVETPNNLEGRVTQCEFGSLVAEQTYECRFTGAAAAQEAVLAINVNGVFRAQDGHQHLSSRSLSVVNPAFNLAEFREARRREAASRTAEMQPRRIPTQRQ